MPDARGRIGAALVLVAIATPVFVFVATRVVSPTSVVGASVLASWALLCAGLVLVAADPDSAPDDGIDLTPNDDWGDE